MAKREDKMAGFVWRNDDTKELEKEMADGEEPTSGWSEQTLPIVG